MFSLSRMRFLCTKVKRYYERAHNEWCSETYGILDLPRLVFPSSHIRFGGKTYGTLVVPRLSFTSGSGGGGDCRRETLFVSYDFCIV
jgi:hypothetical protein